MSNGDLCTAMVFAEQGAGANLLGIEFWVVGSWFVLPSRWLSLVVRHDRSALGRLKQEATEQTERGSILRYLLLSLEAGPFRADDADFFS